MKYYNYLFYTFYRSLALLGNEDLYLEAIAYFASASILWLNLLTAICIIELIKVQSITNDSIVLIIYILYLVVNYVYFFRKNRYKIFEPVGSYAQ